MEGATVSLVSVGQDTGLRRFFGNPMGGIIGAVASVVSLALAIVFYLQSQRYPELVYLARPVPVVLASPAGRYRSSSRGRRLFRMSSRCKLPLGIKAERLSARSIFWSLWKLGFSRRCQHWKLRSQSKVATSCACRPKTLLNYIVMAECHSLSVSWNKATTEQSRSSTPEFETSRRK